MKYAYGVFSAALLAGATQASADVCRALVLSGGGNNGAWEAGVLYGLVNTGDAADFTYDVVTGVSAGAINTMALAGWEIGREAEMVQWLSDLWKNLSSSDVWVDWPLGKISGITIMDGAVDNTPLVAFLRSTLRQFSGYARRVTMGSVEVGSGTYTEFDQTNTDFSKLSDAAVASASIPFIFPPFNWEGRGIFMDGGTVYNINIEGAVRQCLDIVDDESKIIMDVLICGAPDEPTVQTEDGHVWQNWFRARELRKYYGNTDSLAYSISAHKDLEMRYVIKQTESHEGGLSELNFDGDFTWPMQEQGRLDAADAINATNGVNVKNFIDEWNADLDLQATVTVGDYIKQKSDRTNLTEFLADQILE